MCSSKMSVLSFSGVRSLGIVQRLNQTTGQISQSYERLSSGLRINHASDDAASLSIASSLRVGTRVYAQGIKNINDGISALSIADGALGQLGIIMDRLAELAEQSANGTYTLLQRRALDKEADQMVKEFNRIVGSTTFNGLSLLAGGQSQTNIQMGFGIDGSLGFTLAKNLEREQALGTYGTATDVASDTTQRVLSGDFNGDGLDDLVAAGTTVGEGKVQLSTGDGTFNTVTLSFSGAGTLAGVGDFNGDGNLDVVFTTATGSGEANFFAGQGNGSFDVATTSSIDTAAFAGRSADFNGDGNLDLMISQGGSLYVSEGDGSGNFAKAQTVVTAAAGNILGFNVGDINGDGIIDVAYSNSSNTDIVTAAGAGNGSFT